MAGGSVGQDLGPRDDHVVDVDRRRSASPSGAGAAPGFAVRRRRAAAGWRGRRRLGRRLRVGFGALGGASSANERRRSAPRRAAPRRRARRGRRSRRGAGGAATAVAPPRAAFEPVDAFGQRLQRRARVAPGQAHQRDLEHEPRVGGVGAAHVDDRLTERLERAHEHRCAQLLAERAERLAGRLRGASTRTRPRAEVSRNASRTVDEQVFGEPTGLVPGVEQLAERDERAGDVLVGHRPQDRQPTARTRCRRTARSTCSTSTAPCAIAWSSSDSESRIEPAPARAMTASASRSASTPSSRAHVGQVTDDLVDGVERELVVLGARPDRGRDLQRVGGGEHEHDVLGRLLERLQQRGLGAGAEHVHLVEDVHLLRAAGAQVGDPLQQVAHLLDPALRRRVDLDHVERRALGDRDAALAHAARIAVVARVRAVQRLGEEAGGRGLAGAPGPGEEVGVTDPAVAHRVPERGGDVLLADELGESLWAVLAVQRLVGHGPTVASVNSRKPGPESRRRAHSVLSSTTRCFWEVTMLAAPRAHDVPTPPVRAGRLDRPARSARFALSSGIGGAFKTEFKLPGHREPGRVRPRSSGRASATARCRRRSSSPPTRGSTTAVRAGDGRPVRTRSSRRSHDVDVVSPYQPRAASARSGQNGKIAYAELNLADRSGEDFTDAGQGDPGARREDDPRPRPRDRLRRRHVRQPRAQRGERSHRHPRRDDHPAHRVRVGARDGPADRHRAVRHRHRRRDRADRPQRRRHARLHHRGGGDDRARRRHRLRAVHRHPLPREPRSRARSGAQRGRVPSTPPGARCSSPARPSSSRCSGCCS